METDCCQEADPKSKNPKWRLVLMLLHGPVFALLDCGFCHASQSVQCVTAPGRSIRGPAELKGGGGGGGFVEDQLPVFEN